MIFNMYISGGNDSTTGPVKTVTIYGGANETVYLYGTKSLSIPLDSTGKASVSIPQGDYIISGSMSEQVISGGRLVTITSSTSTVNVFPGKAIYWFGNGHLANSPLLTTYGEYTTTGRTVATGNETKNYTVFGDDYVRAQMYSNGSSEWRSLTTNANLIDFTGYSTINFYGSHPYRATPHYKLDSAGNYYIDYYAGNRGYFGISTDRQTLAIQDANASITKQVVSIPISSSITSGYCGVEARSQGEVDDDWCYTDMYACWLE